LDRSQLKAHVEAMPNRLDEMMSGDGGNFLRGQRQLLALARAILCARPILALDEPTSSIDVKTDAAIQQTIRESFEGATFMTIAHRISTIIDYDVIVVMDRGRVVEMGPPTDLLRRRDGQLQTSGNGGRGYRRGHTGLRVGRGAVIRTLCRVSYAMYTIYRVSDWQMLLVRT
jgi:ABC-type multidrug transport system fused ATPase/permease subunit